MPLINCKINLIITWSANCVISEVNRVTTIPLADTKLYAPVVTLSTNDQVKLLQQLRSSFKRTINWNKYQSKVTIQQKNPYLDYLIDPSFQGVNKLFVLAFPHNTVRTGHTNYFIPSAEIKDYNVMIDGQNFFDQSVKNNIKTNNKILQIMAGQADDYTTSCLPFYSYFNENYKIIAIDLSKQEALDADPKVIKQINFTTNLDRAGNTTLFIVEEAKETIFIFSEGTVKVL